MVSARLLSPTTEATAIGGMTKRYLFALGLVAVLSLTAYISLRETIATQETSAAIVNYSGKRRYTSQRAALFAQQLVLGTTAAERSRARHEMLTSIQTMEDVHHGLLHGNPALRLPGHPSPAIAAIYFSGERPVDQLIREYIARVRALAGRQDDELAPDHPDLRWIVATAPGELLDALDNLVQMYQRESETEIARIQRLESIVLVATLSVLVMEAFFIFRPMVGRVREERRKLVRAESYTRAILDNSYDAILTIDRAGQVRSANRATTTMFDVGLSDLINRSFVALAPGHDLPSEWSEPPQGLRSLKVTRSDGKAITIDAAFTMASVDHEVVVIATLRESTEQLQRYARDLERRNQELDQFAYVASHDLKAPLRAIVNLSQWIEEDAKDTLSPLVRDHLAMMRSRVRRLETLIDGIHRYATATRPDHAPEPIDTGTLVREISEEQNAGGRFIINVPERMPTVIADRTRLWQVFSNLIANAVKHHHQDHGRIDIGVREIGERYEFSVADDGPGIAPEFHERIFVIFQTLTPKDVKDSLGLGLALVKKIVREEGGTITLESSVGKGATFRFTWPKRPEPRSEVAHA
ncbi:MAG TPA: ATP-binding protein [Planctomycetota bacterium]|nr:ATP-binding protein [Planctomycetota bacterium]